MYRHSQQIALVAMIGAIIFTFAAFLGLHFWYAGFISFFWLSLSALNYRHETSLWILKNNFKRFLYLYLFLFVLGFIGDFVIGINIANLWAYPEYDAVWKWILLCFFRENERSANLNIGTPQSKVKTTNRLMPGSKALSGVYIIHI